MALLQARLSRYHGQCEPGTDLLGRALTIGLNALRLQPRAPLVGEDADQKIARGNRDRQLRHRSARAGSAVHQIIEMRDRQVGHAEELRPSRALAVIVGAACDANAVMLGQREVVSLLSEIVGAVIDLDRTQARGHERRDDLVLLRISGVRERRQPPSCRDERNDISGRGAPVWDVRRR